MTPVRQNEYRAKITIGDNALLSTINDWNIYFFFQTQLIER
jgi:hypothetical protein